MPEQQWPSPSTQVMTVSQLQGYFFYFSLADFPLLIFFLSFYFIVSLIQCISSKISPSDENYYYYYFEVVKYYETS